MFLFPGNRHMVDKEEVDGRHLCSGQKTVAGIARPGKSPPHDISIEELPDVIVSSIRSSSSKKIPPLSLPAASKKKPTDSPGAGVNRAIPGPGDEVESDPDAGVVDSEKVTVVFLVCPTINRRS